MADLDALRSAYRESRPDDHVGHLSARRWERLFCDELEIDERQAALGHILECPLCSDTYRAVQILRSEAADFDDAAPAPSEVTAEKAVVRRFRWRGLGVLAMAATVVLAVVLPLRRAHEPGQADVALVVRSAGAEKPVTPVSPLGTVGWRSEDDLMMRWTMVESSSVLVEILDVDGELIWTGPETKATEGPWPAAEIPGPGRYFWQVLVRDRNSAAVDSELVSFDLVSASRP